jgi:hypothetical protein
VGKHKNHLQQVMQQETDFPEELSDISNESAHQLDDVASVHHSLFMIQGASEVDQEEDDPMDEVEVRLMVQSANVSYDVPEGFVLELPSGSWTRIEEEDGTISVDLSLPPNPWKYPMMPHSWPANLLLPVVSL